MEERREELRGFTVERLKELCSKVHIKVYGKTKDELIEHLPESEYKAGSTEKEGGEAFSLTKHLMELIIQMQREQRTWLEGQQKKQEELIQWNQQVQKEMVDAVLATQAPPTEAPSGSGRVKPPKPTP